MNTNYYEQQLRKSEKMSWYSFEKEADFLQKNRAVSPCSLPDIARIICILDFILIYNPYCDE